MNSELKQSIYGVYCSRDIIFKKYNSKISELVRLDFNIDILPKDKTHIYTDIDGNKNTDIFYIDMSSNEFIAYNEDLKKCGYYDYNKQQINYHNLPLNKKIHSLPNNYDKIKSLDLINKIIASQSKINDQQNCEDDDEDEDEDDDDEDEDEDDDDEDEDEQYNEEDDVLLKIAISESLKYININKSTYNNDNNLKLSGLKAEERRDIQKNKYKIKPKTKISSFEFQDEKIGLKK
jgi:hypothetical protein